MWFRVPHNEELKLFSPHPATDAPKVLGSVVVYTWEGNPANISCEVKAHPGASVLWFRDGLPLPSANSSNIKIHHTPTTSYLEVSWTQPPPPCPRGSTSWRCLISALMFRVATDVCHENFLILFLFPLLQVNPNSQNDFGSYNCSATNVMGTESKEFLLISAGVSPD